MITVDLMGGMGNLMFQYAFARTLSEELGMPIKFNAQFMNLVSLGAYHHCNTNNALLHLKGNDSVCWENPILGYIKAFWDILYFLLLRHKGQGRLLHGQESFTKLSKKGLLSTDDGISYYHYAAVDGSTDRKLFGYFQSPKYFSRIADILHEEFRVTTPPSPENEKKIAELSSCNSVCVHIRRGDYISNHKNSLLVVCNNTYYNAGMRYIASQTENPIFYIFSNDSKDINWLQKHYQFDYPVKYITLNNPDYEELRLMYSCKHFVISNSTFSWWGSFLSPNPKKIIVAPTPWLKDYEASQDIYTDDMVLFDANGQRRDNI